MSRFLAVPKGRFSIGSVSTVMVDINRARSLIHDEPGRKLYIKIWYPAGKPDNQHVTEPLWEQLGQQSDLPLMMRCLSRWAARYKTHTFPQVDFAADCQPKRVVIYNHGLIGFASENYSLMEELAGNGYIVIGVQHVDQLQEYRGLENRVSKSDKQEVRQLTSQLQSVSGQEQQEIAVKFYRMAKNTNAIAAQRALDSQFVIANCKTLFKEFIKTGFDLDHDWEFSAVGLSLGGAVSMELAKINSQVSNVVNIDGGVFGNLREQPLEVPCSMVYSESNNGINDLALLESADNVDAVVVEDSKHLNFHDISLLFPRLLKLLGAIGNSDSISITEIRNSLVKEFISKHSG